MGVRELRLLEARRPVKVSIEIRVIGSRIDSLTVMATKLNQKTKVAAAEAAGTVMCPNCVQKFVIDKMDAEAQMAQ
eukprot:COSAG02_NODE_4105_length_5770_cov_5.409981_2_plen_76_part_00